MSYICEHCGSLTEPKKVTPGSIVLEIMLWILFLPAGIIYTVYRCTNKVKACTACGSKHILPVVSPRGEQLRREFYPVGKDNVVPIKGGA